LLYVKRAFSRSAEQEGPLKIDLSHDEITVLRLLVQAGMNTLEAQRSDSEPNSETVGELLLKKFDLALAPQETRENNEPDRPAL
jgi:hypothetical protein